MTEAMDIESRVAFHAALADPTRLRIVDVLRWGDASPGRIQRELGISSNLLAHHLAQLSTAGIVSRHRSEGDGRRTYVRLDPTVVGLLGAVSPVGAERVLFVCTGNSARSQLAAALWRRASDVPAMSAGTHPAVRVAPGAVAVAARNGLSLAGARPALLDDVATGSEFIVTVCDCAHEELREAADVHWSVPDPVVAGSDAAFDAAFAEIAARIDILAAHTN